MSKGSKRRPQQVSEEVMNDNWEKAFPKLKKDMGDDTRTIRRDTDIANSMGGSINRPESNGGSENS